MSPVKQGSFFTARCFFLLPSRRERETEPRRTTSHQFDPLLSFPSWFVQLGCKVQDRLVISWAPAVSKPTSLITIKLCYFALAKSLLNGFEVNCGFASCVWMYVRVWNVGCEREQEEKDLFFCVNVTLAPQCLCACLHSMKMNRRIWKKLPDF